MAHNPVEIVGPAVKGRKGCRRTERVSQNRKGVAEPKRCRRTERTLFRLQPLRGQLAHKGEALHSSQVLQYYIVTLVLYVRAHSSRNNTVIDGTVLVRNIVLVGSVKMYDYYIFVSKTKS